MQRLFPHRMLFVMIWKIELAMGTNIITLSLHFPRSLQPAARLGICLQRRQPNFHSAGGAICPTLLFARFPAQRHPFGLINTDDEKLSRWHTQLCQGQQSAKEHDAANNNQRLACSANNSTRLGIKQLSLSGEFSFHYYSYSFCFSKKRKCFRI
jgi:hypothetical protein